MSKRRKKNRQDKRPKAAPAKRRFSGTIAVLLAAAILAGLGFGWWKVKALDISPAVKATDAANTVNQPVAASNSAFEKLNGRWLRPDGGYVLEIRSVDAGGKIDAVYLNPKPINIGKAEATRDGSTLKVFVELRAANYPGSTYMLTYDPQQDQLRGIYFQAVQQQSFNVNFVRMK